MNLLPEIRKEGIQLHSVCYPKSFLEKIALVREIKRFDIVYLQKKLMTSPELRVLRRYAKRLFFDFDDAVYCKDDTHAELESRSRELRFHNIVRNADLVVAGNTTLAGCVGPFNKNVVVVPSAVETRNIPVKDYSAVGTDIIIGWVGGKGNLHHLQMLSPILQRLSREHRIQVNIVCDAAIDIPSVRVNHIPWRLETQEREIALFDIGVMPLPDNEWARGKCGYKALQYMAAAVPSVISDVGSNRDILEHDREGFLVSSTDGFYHSIQSLIRDKNLRERIGGNARKKVEKTFSIHAVGKKLAAVLQ